MNDLHEVAQQYRSDFHNGKITSDIKTAFIDGAEWQKEQDKEVINLARNLLLAYDTRHPNEPQLLLSISNIDAINKIINHL